jgi:4-amino-4-deoxy-L-arabinose transferase-like glycosyltransferase
MIDGPKRYLLILFALCTVLYFIGLAVPSLTDPDDTFYGETAKEMTVQGSVLTPLIFEQPNFEKPPLYLWLVMVSYKLFGVNALTSRLVSAAFGILSVLGTFHFLRKVLSDQTAFLAAIMLASAAWWIGLTHVVLTDMVFSTLIAFAMYSFYLWFKLQKRSHLLLFGLFTGLATMAKTPLGLVLPLLCAIVFLIVSGNRQLIRSLLVSRWWLLFLVIVLPWYLYASIKYGNAFLWEYFVNCHWNRLLHAEHHQFNTLYFYLGVLFVGLIPWTCYLPVIGAAYKRLRSEHLFAICWLVVMYVIFNVAQSKLSTYISPVFPSVAMLVAMSALEESISRYRNLAVTILLIAAGVGLGIAPTFLNKQFPELVIPGLMSFGAIALASLAASYLIFRRRIRTALTASVIGMVGFSVITPFALFPKLETGLTDSDLPTYVEQYHLEHQPVLTTALHCRGVYFYTGNPVVVMAGSKKPFWSMHPVTILSEDQELRDFVSARDTLLCVFSKGDFDRLDRLTSSDRENKQLSRNIDRVVMLSTKRVAPTP